MKAAVFNGPKPNPPFLEIQDVPPIDAIPGGVVVQVLTSSIVSYSWDIFTGERAYPNLLPFVPGPGAVGIIKSVGPDVVLLERGQLVFCDSTVRARDEPYAKPMMLQGLIARSPEAQRLQSVWRNGGWAEEMLVPAENVFRIPPSINLDPSTLSALASVSVPFGGLYEDGICTGNTVVITGATGHFGSAAVLAAVALGARKVIPCGRSKAALDIYVEMFGNRVSPVVLCGDEKKDTQAIQEAAGEGFYVDVHFDMLPPGASSSVARSAMQAVRHGGRVILMGGLRGYLETIYGDLVRKGITIKGVWMCPRHAFPILIGLVDAGLLDLTKFRMKEFKLEEINEGVSWAREHRGAFERAVVVV